MPQLFYLLLLASSTFAQVTSTLIPPIQPIDILINSLSENNKVIIQVEYIQHSNKWWVLLNQDTNTQYLAREEPQGAVVIKKAPNIMSILEEIEDRDVAKNLMEQLVAIEISKNGGIIKTQEYIETVVSRHGSNAFLSVGPVARAAYMNHGIKIP